ncbi:hypothetical protein PFISCL1PPCAC_4038, partial [Pristionchus fissidentatus]
DNISDLERAFDASNDLPSPRLLVLYGRCAKERAYIIRVAREVMFDRLLEMSLIMVAPTEALYNEAPVRDFLSDISVRNKTSVNINNHYHSPVVLE